MNRVYGLDAKMVAVMHDLLEDTSIRDTDLIRYGFDSDIIQALDALTKNAQDTRFTAAQRTIKNALACKVKLADLADNMNLSRLKMVQAKDLKRLKQYKIVQTQLQEADRIYSFIEALNAQNDYPVFSYSSRAINYQYLLNLMFDQSLELHHDVSYPSQEWWILFEDCSYYLSWCKRHNQIAELSYCLSLIKNTDQAFFNAQFSNPASQALFKEILHQFNHIFINI